VRNSSSSATEEGIFVTKSRKLSGDRDSFSIVVVRLIYLSDENVICSLVSIDSVLPTFRSLHICSLVLIFGQTTIEYESLYPESFLDFVTNIHSSVAEELEFRTRGQAENTLWKAARKVRITASNFHDIKTRKPNTPATNLVKKIVNESEKDLILPALKWGRKMEPIAKKRYKAFNKLKLKQNVTIMEKGLFICSTYGFLGASPDGLVMTGGESYLIEVKCPYKYRFQTIDDACKDNSFCCFLNDDNNVQQRNKYHAEQKYLHNERKVF
jgi:hypothetical protein